MATTLKHPIIEKTATFVYSDKSFMPDGDRRFTIQFWGDSEQWVYAFPLRNEILMTQEQAFEAINKMEEVSLLIGFEGTMYRLVELI
jgi:hypothetical protein